MSANEKFCPFCGATRQGDDRFCYRCGKPLPQPVAAGESAPVAVPAGPEATAGWLDFILHPARLFAHGRPPLWGIALALVALTGLGSGAVQAVAQAGLERALPAIISAVNLPAEIINQFDQVLAASREQALSRTAGVLIGLAFSIPKAIAGYLIVSGIFFGLGKWAGGRGSWESFTRNYALLAITEIPQLLANGVVAVLLLLAVPPALLLLAGLAALLIGTLMWVWKLWLRYALLTGNLRVSNGRAAAIVAGWEALKISLLLLVAGGFFLLTLLVALIGS